MRQQQFYYRQKSKPIKSNEEQTNNKRIKSEFSKIPILKPSFDHFKFPQKNSVKASSQKRHVRSNHKIQKLSAVPSEERF